MTTMMITVRDVQKVSGLQILFYQMIVHENENNAIFKFGLHAVHFDVASSWQVMQGLNKR